MTRQEFLDELRIALQGEMDQGRINEHLDYYENYIMEEARKGRTEQHVLEDLGNPRLIAKTLIDAEQYGGGAYGKSYDSGEQSSGGVGFKNWHARLVMIVIAILIIIFVASLVAFLLPIVVPVVLVLVVLSLVLGGRR